MSGTKFTDVQHLQLFIAEYKDSLFFSSEHNAWYEWDNISWRRSTQSGFSGVLNSAVALSTKLGDGKYELHSVPRMNYVLKLASQSEMVIPLDRIDSDPYLITTSSGTVDLRSGVLRTPEATDFITHCLKTPYNPAATAPKFEKFLREITCGDADYAEYLQKVVGLSLIGKHIHDGLFFLYGGGSNGKSTFVNTLQSILGPLAVAAPQDLLLGNGDSKRDAVVLEGARLAVTSETDEGKFWSEATLKALTGGDFIPARRLYGEVYEFPPSHTFLIMGNHKPGVRGTDDGLWRRFSMLPFNAKFGSEDMNPHLRNELLAEASGILAWAVRGCIAYQKNGLTQPKIVAHASAEYRKEADYFGDFLETCINRSDKQDAFISSSSMFNLYLQWARSTNPSGRHMSQPALTKKLKSRGLVYLRTNKARGWSGVELVANPDLPFHNSNPF